MFHYRAEKMPVFIGDRQYLNRGSNNTPLIFVLSLVEMPVKAIKQTPTGVIWRRYCQLRNEDEIRTETGRRIFVHFQGMKTGT
ncbi:hypothetical protein [Candidatus Venteria ishoeyi]|uniref:hypothetical protein n=1 Tax=Candidatus Venteria ishoeyi TaxID=1899563 RepID=UPI0011B04B22|nr:hypothetical protein [Candidatus Venteria ishoeyi]